MHGHMNVKLYSCIENIMARLLAKTHW